MTLVWEPICWGEEHVPFNAGMLEVIRKAYPDERIQFFGERTHIEHLRRQLGPPLGATISWRQVALPGRRVSNYRRLPFEINIIRRLLKEIQAGSGGDLLFTSVMPTTVAVWTVLSQRARRKALVHAILHGNASELNGCPSVNPLRWVWSMRTALALGTKHIRYLALEECMRASILKILPSLSGRIDVLEHPIPPNEGECEALELSLPIRFGFLGVANELKGFPLFVRLASEMRTRYPGKVEFHAIGNFSRRVDSAPGLDALTTKPGTGLLSRADFTSRIRSLHFVIFPYRPGHYEFSPSGALMDAIAWKKPFIASRIPIFTSMVESYGDIGYLYSSELELRTIVRNLVEKADRTYYSAQATNLEGARRARTAAALSQKYRQMRIEATPLNRPKAKHTQEYCA